MKRSKNESGNVLAIVIIIVVLAALGWYAYRQQMGFTYMLTNPQSQNMPSSDNLIQNDAVLMKESTNLDTTDIDGTFNPDLNQVNTDSQTL